MPGLRPVSAATRLGIRRGIPVVRRPDRRDGLGLLPQGLLVDIRGTEPTASLVE